MSPLFLLLLLTASHASPPCEEVRTVSYFIDGVAEVNSCLESIRPMYGGGQLQVVHYRLTHKKLVECLGLLDDQDTEIYLYLKDACSQQPAAKPLPKQPQEDLLTAHFDEFVSSFENQSHHQRALTEREVMQCEELRSVYTIFAGLRADIYELIRLCQKWIDAIDPP